MRGWDVWLLCSRLMPWGWETQLARAGDGAAQGRAGLLASVGEGAARGCWQAQERVQRRAAGRRRRRCSAGLLASAGEGAALGGARL